jgi:hypothetical protein
LEGAETYPGKGFALDIPLKNSGIRKPEVRSQKPEYLDVSAALDNLFETVGVEAV